MKNLPEPELVFDVFMFKVTYHVTKKNRLKKHGALNVSFTGIINCN